MFGKVRLAFPPGFREVRKNSAASGTLRAAVLGMNDGLVSNLSLVMGVTGGTSDSAIILLVGIAGLLAGAFSMASGEYVSMKAQKDHYEHILDIKRGEVERFPEGERGELVNIYKSKGLSIDEAKTVARWIMREPETALDTMAREGLGLDPNQLGSPWMASLSSFLSFAVGAFVPILPHTIWTEGLAFTLSGLFSAIILACVGCLLAGFSGKNIVVGGARMLIIGMVSASLTFGLGTLVGRAIGTNPSAL